MFERPQAGVFACFDDILQMFCMKWDWLFRSIWGLATRAQICYIKIKYRFARMAREGAILKRDSNALTKRSYRAHPLYRRHLNTVRALIYRKTADLQVEMAITPEPVAYADRLGLQYRPMRAGERWGKMFDCGWARVRGNVGAAVAADPSAYVAVLDIEIGRAHV